MLLLCGVTLAGPLFFGLMGIWPDVDTLLLCVGFVVVVQVVVVVEVAEIVVVEVVKVG